MIDFQTYLRGGLIKPQNPDFKQIEQQITRSEKDLKACGMLITADPEWASAIAYQSMLRAGRALLFSKGYLPCDGRQHKTVVEITGEILGKEFAIIKRFDLMRKRRNVFFYDSCDFHGSSEAKKAVETAGILLQKIKQEIRRANPQQGVQF